VPSCINADILYIMSDMKDLNELARIIKNCRICGGGVKMILSTGPDVSFYNPKIFSCNNFLNVGTEIFTTSSQEFSEISFEINTNSNEYNVIFKSDMEPREFYNSSLIEDFYFYIHCKCTKCDSYVNTSDISIDTKSKTFSNFFIEQELIVLRDDDNIVCLAHEANDSYYNANVNGQKFKLKKFDLDFKNQAKTIHKIIALMCF
jgi:hypothetical protein